MAAQTCDACWLWIEIISLAEFPYHVGHGAKQGHSANQMFHAYIHENKVFLNM